MSREYGIQVRVFGDELTPEQDKLEDKYFEAVMCLRVNGFKAKVNKIAVFKPTDNPANIYLEE